MYNILSIFKHIYEQLKKNDPRFVIKDIEHFIDTKTGIEFHLYKDYFKLTHGDKEIITNQQLTEDEQAMIWQIRMLLLDPAKVKEYIEEYPALVRSRRLHLSELYSNPAPIMQMPAVQAEKETKQYNG